MEGQRVVLITGASSGIGYATAVAFAREGTHVVGTARRAERLEALKREIDALPEPHGEFLPVVGDVRESDAVKNAVQQALEHFGRLDVLVANAGVGHRGSLVEADWEDIETLLRTNVDGVLHSIRAAVPAMRESGQGGHILLVSSVAYNMIAPYAAMYAASKAFVSSIGRSLRLELEPDGIHVTELFVGRTETEFNKTRLGKPGRAGGGVPVMSADEVADAIVKASRSRKKTVALRWFDRLILLGNRLVPELVGRLAMKQYRTD